MIILTSENGIVEIKYKTIMLGMIKSHISLQYSLVVGWKIKNNIW